MELSTHKQQRIVRHCIQHRHTNAQRKHTSGKRRNGRLHFTEWFHGATVRIARLLAGAPERVFERCLRSRAAVSRQVSGIAADLHTKPKA